MTALGPSDSTWIFLGFVVAFAVKAPLWPFHGWLPDAYREVAARGGGAALRRGLEDGGLRLARGSLLAVLPGARSRTGGVVLVLASIGLVYGSLLAFRAPDVRGVIAYSSLAQMSLIVIGLFAVNDSGLDGALLQMVIHGLISAALFLLAGAVERRTGPGASTCWAGWRADGRVLATVLIAAGVIALAVPGSARSPASS